MSQNFAQRAAKIQPSITLALSAKTKALKAQGLDVVNLTAGEPDFDTPEHIKQAAIEAMRQGLTKYTAVDGMPELKQAVQEKFVRDNQLNFDLDQILISCGAKHSLYNLHQALLNPGDEVIIPTPYWVSYPSMALLADAKPVYINTNIDQHYKITAEQLADKITKKTRLFLLNSPSNPSGMIYHADELKKLAEVLMANPHVYIASDDMYEHIIWPEQRPFHNILNVCPELADRTVIVNGASKVYSMTGWRIGYAAGPKDLIGTMKRVQSHSTSNPCSIAQAAALAGLTGPQDCVDEMVAAYQQRHEFVFNALEKIPGLRCQPVSGTFYTFPDISEILATNPHIQTDFDFAEKLLNEANVSVVPGTAFGMPGCMRLSYAVSMDDLEKAMARLHDFVNKLTK